MSSSTTQPRIARPISICWTTPYAFLGPNLIEACGCGEVINFEPFNLDNPIHPIFARENWLGQNLLTLSHSPAQESLYLRMVPVLQLAPRLLQSPASIRWIGKTIFGTEILHPTAQDQKMLVDSPHMEA